MKITITTLTILSVVAVMINQPAQAQLRPNDVGPSVTFGGGNTVFGIDSRFPVTPNISIRPSIRFPTGGVAFGTAATYDFDINGIDRRLEPYVGAGFNIYTGDNNNNGGNFVGYAIGGADYYLSDQFTLKGSVTVPFQNNYSTGFTIGVGYKY